MSDDRRHRFGLAIALIGALSIPWGPGAEAENLRGHVQVQYQKLENGKAVNPTIDREYWVTSFELDYATKLRPDLTLTSQVQYTNLDYSGRSEGSRQPYGMLRLSHSKFGLFGSYRPLTQTDPLGATSRQKQGIVSGYWSAPRWPRVDVNWIRRRFESDQKLGNGTGITRSVLLGHALGPLSFRGGYTDQASEPDQAPGRRVFQRSRSGGATYNLGHPTASLLFQYDFTDSRRQALSGLTDVVQTHTANANGGKRLSRKTDVALTYLFRHTETRNGLDQSFSDSDGSAVFNYTPAPPFRLSTGGGVRTVHSGPSQEYEEYALASASADGRLRKNWTGGAGTIYSVNWLRDGRRYAANSYRLNSIMHPRKGIDLNGSAQVSLNDRPAAVGDTSGATVPGRVSSQVSLGGSATPRPSFTLGYMRTAYRVGESLTGAGGTTATTDTWDVRWRPLPTVQLTGNSMRTGGRGRGDSSQRTSRANLDWDWSRATKISGSYTKSDFLRIDPTVPRVPGREVLNVRLLSALGRDLVANVSVNWLDPGSARAIQQLDATLTRRFGG